MKLIEAEQQIKAGEFGVIAEVRAARAKRRTGTGKNGQPYDMRYVEFRLEVGNDLVEGDVMLPDDTDVETWKSPFTKGDRVLLRLEPRRQGYRTFVGFREVVPLQVNGK